MRTSNEILITAINAMTNALKLSLKCDFLISQGDNWLRSHPISIDYVFLKD